MCVHNEQGHRPEVPVAGTASSWAIRFDDTSRRGAVATPAAISEATPASIVCSGLAFLLLRSKRPSPSRWAERLAV